jgi:branched-chain amino acid aminotransferase
MVSNALEQPGFEHANTIWINGELRPWEQATVHVSSVGHASTSGVFEGMKAYWSPETEQLNLFRMREHFQRFVESMRLVRLDLSYTVDQLCQATIDLLRADDVRQDVYIRPWSFASGLIRQQMVPADHPSDVVIDYWPFQRSFGSGKTTTAAVSSWRRIDDSTVPPRVKAFSNYHNGRFALMEANRNGYDWPILLSSAGYVSEGASACIGMFKDGVLITPPVSGSVLDSITRDTILTLAREELGYPVETRVFDRSEMLVADEAFFMGTAWEIMPLSHIDGLKIGSGDMGAHTRALETAYRTLVDGQNENRSDWLQSVYR